MGILDFGGDVISAGVNAWQGSENREAQERWNQQQLALAREQMAMQREFAQMGIRWKVEDAKAAGLHPLAALGAQVSSPSPVSVGGEAPKYDFGSMGQDLSRAFKAAATKEERDAIDAKRAKDLAAEGLALDNDIKRTEIASRLISTARQSGQVGPPLPRPGPNRTVDGLAVNDDDLKQKQGDIPQQAFSRPFGYKVYHNPYFSDGQVAEDRYGDSEILSTAKAAANLVADHLYTGYLAFPRDGWGISGGGSRSRWRSPYRSRSRPWGE